MYSIYNKTLASSFKEKELSSEKAYLESGSCNWEWYDPPENAIPVNFCLDTSLHGLKYLGQTRRHLCEREFLSKLSSHTNEDWKQASFALLDLQHICETAKPFTEKFTTDGIMNILAEGKSKAEADILRNLTNDSAEIHDSDPNRLLHEGSQKCNEMILFCLWLDQERNCSKIFQEIETDFGYCCTFNTIPITLLQRYLNFTTETPETVKEWRQENLDTDNLFPPPGAPYRKYPRRQFHPGRSAGLSILLDPDLDEYFCPNTDCCQYAIRLPSNEGSPKDPLCQPNQYNCTDQVRRNITQGGLGVSCTTCLPPCTEIVYQTDATSLTVRKESIDRLFKQYDKYSSDRKVSIVHVYFSVDSAYPRLRQELYTIIDLLSNTGGLLGLCMGFSFLSLLEILYYFTIRIFFRFYRRKAKPSEMLDPENESVISLKDPRLIKQAWLSRVFQNSQANNNVRRIGQNIGITPTGVISTGQGNPMPPYFNSPFELQCQYPTRISIRNEIEKKWQY
ncbi:unnamed protein product [Orchesella dallaii]|uniref:Pickpocket protein 28 n=1 Tax=Orchesella dallaii TaxID=48710 RepID=A0ABP1PSJ7_9HEXA